jgi:hypothetical protein
LLLDEEERWRLKSKEKETWIKSGDKNMKYFHHFSSYRWNKKHIWEVKDDSRQVHYGQDAIKMDIKLASSEVTPGLLAGAEPDTHQFNVTICL